MLGYNMLGRNNRVIIASFHALGGARTLDELPANARRYVRRLEELCGAPLLLVSVGPGRNETIMLRNPFLPS